MSNPFNISDEFRLWCPVCLTMLVEAAEELWFCPSEKCKFVGSAEEALGLVA